MKEAFKMIAGAILTLPCLVLAGVSFFLLWCTGLLLAIGIVGFAPPVSFILFPYAPIPYLLLRNLGILFIILFLRPVEWTGYMDDLLGTCRTARERSEMRKAPARTSSRPLDLTKVSFLRRVPTTRSIDEETQPGASESDDLLARLHAGGINKLG